MTRQYSHDDIIFIPITDLPPIRLRQICHTAN
jgi:hypothetical protein